MRQPREYTQYGDNHIERSQYTDTYRFRVNDHQRRSLRKQFKCVHEKPTIDKR